MPSGPPAEQGPQDPNRSRRGAHQRVGPFWIEEPIWFWAAALGVVVLGAVLLALAILGDPP